MEKNAYYVHPMKLWFSAAPVGKEHAQWSGERNILEAGLAGRYTYIAYKLFSSGVSEALVQNRTVHRSLEGLRKYKRVTAKQDLYVSSILGAPHITIENHLKHSMEQER